jgi:hypothetical protein
MQITKEPTHETEEGLMTKSIDLFLSHNSADKLWTERLASAIEADRSGPPLKVFFDKWDVPYGGDIPAELEQGLQDSRYVGLVLSPEALASDWVTLERSTAIHRDPGARQRSLIPLLLRTCEMPDMLARLKHIDFRREQDFDAGLQALVAILRGRPAERGGELDVADAHFREDAALLRQHRRIFNRPGFQVSCICELFLRELVATINDTAAAINTGALYSRSARLLATFPDQNEYRLPEFRQAFSRITGKLTALARSLTEFEDVFRQLNPDYSNHRDFYKMVRSFSPKDPADMRTLVALMDAIDQGRNEILDELNVLLVRCGEQTFERIALSSSVIRNRPGLDLEGVAQFL